MFLLKISELILKIILQIKILIIHITINLLHKVKEEIKNGYTKFDKYGNKFYTQQPIKHYILNHNHIPPWILLKNISFSNAISLYKLLKPTQKQKVTENILQTTNIDINEKIQFLTAALDLYEIIVINCP